LFIGFLWVRAVRYDSQMLYFLAIGPSALPAAVAHHFLSTPQA
jgi:hypothetical protein